MSIRKKRIETLVTDILRECEVSEPPVDVEAIAEKHRLLVHFQPLQSDLSGFLFHDEQHAVIGVNSSHPNVRQRFTIAHELGHFLLHQNDPLHVDRAVHAKFRNDLSKQGTDPEEIEANLFAAELLIPRMMVALDLHQNDVVDILDDHFFNELAQRYNVSTQALLLRLMNLGYIDQ
jgi:Zn-dependent peptidase ImmA (M78 family)